MQSIRTINRELPIPLIVEQDVRVALSIAGRVTIVETGRKIYDGPPDPLHNHV